MPDGGGISTGIELYDGFSDTLNAFSEGLAAAAESVNELQSAMGQNVNTTAMDSVADGASQATQQVNELTQAVHEANEAAQNMAAPAFPVGVSQAVNTQQPITPQAMGTAQESPVNVYQANAPPQISTPELNIPDNIVVPVTPEVTTQPEIDVPDALTVPVTPTVTQQPQIDTQQNITIPVTPEITNSQSLDDVEAQLQQMLQTQQQLTTQAQGLQIVPSTAQQNLASVNNDLVQLQAQLDYIRQNPFNLPTETAQQQITALSDRITEAQQKQQQLTSQLNATSQIQPQVEVPPLNIPQPQPVTVPVQWDTSGIEVFDGSGMERFTQEAASANSMMQQLSDSQARIARQAFNTNLLPNNAVDDLLNMSNRIDTLRTKIQQLSAQPIGGNTSQANAQLEQLRTQLDQAIQQQNELNDALDSMDASAANAAYNSLNQTITNTEQGIRDSADSQNSLNTAIQNANGPAQQLVGTIKTLAATYLSIQSIKGVLDASDELISTTARLNTMNESFNQINGTAQTTQNLLNETYAAAEDARGSFADMASVVAKFGNNARDAFSSQDEVVAFANLIQKQMTIAGASTQEAANVELQLSQALGSGVLRGDELNSIFEQAPNLIQSIADYLDVPIGKIREMAADGQLSADVVKQAIFADADDINAKFNEMPQTWGQLWTSMQNTATMAFQPVLQQVNNLANSEGFQTMVSGAVNALATVAGIAVQIMDQLAQVAQFVQDNWNVLAPVIGGIVALLGTYLAISTALSVAEGIRATVAGISAAAAALDANQTMAQAAAAATAAGAQNGLNAAMMANPVTWVILAIVALIAALIAVANYIASTGTVATTAFGVITGGINVVIQFFRNLGLQVANIAVGIWNALNAVAQNMVIAFQNSIAKVQQFFYNLLSTVASVISQIAAALNALPFVDFDYSGITTAADNFAAKASTAAGNTKDYVSISDAFSGGFDTFDTFQEGWAKDAYASGASWGDSVQNGLTDKVSGLLDGISTDIPSVDDYTAQMNAAIPTGIANSGLADSADKTAKNTEKTKDITEDSLEYLRDIATTEAINRFTDATINVDFSGMTNQVNNNMDIDGVVNTLTQSVNDALEEVAEGMHK